MCWDKNRNKWIASFQYKRKHYYLGRYNTIAEAEKARKKFENEIRQKLGGILNERKNKKNNRKN